MPKDVKEDLSKKLISPMPGLIKSVDVIEGQKVKNADQLLIIEAMKMENILKSEKDCVIEKILVKVGDSVSADEELILFKN
jgi:propionyl-CoA carboxylase alpha chain